MATLRYPEYLRLNSDAPIAEKEQRILECMAKHPEDTAWLKTHLTQQYFSSPPNHHLCVLHCNEIIHEWPEDELVTWAFYLSAILYEETYHQIDEALERYLISIELDDQPNSALLSVTHIYLDRCRWEEAMHWIQTMIATEEFAYDGWFLKGNCHFAQGQLEQALQAYREADKIASNGTGVYYNMGACYARMGDQATAREYIQKVINCDPEDAEAYYGMGQSYQYEGDQYRAMHWYAEALKRQPDYPAVFNNIGALHHEHESDYKATIAMLEKAVQVAKDPLDRKMALIYRNLNKLHRQMLNHDQSEHYKMKWFECQDLLDLYWLSKDNDDDPPDELI